MSDTLPCGHPRLTAGPCPICRHDEALAGATTPARGKASRPIPTLAPECVQRGALMGTDDCQVCGRQPVRRVELFACAVKGSCTVDPEGRVRGVQKCQTCTFEPKTPLQSQGTDVRRPGGA